MLICKGVGVARGCVSGVAAVLRRSTSCAATIEEVYLTARERYRQWSSDAALTPQARDLALVYLALLDDPDLRSSIEFLEQQGRDLSYAITEACEEQARLLDNARHPYLRERASDLRALAREILTIGGSSKGEIWLTESLTPADIYEASAVGVLGVVMKEPLPAASHLAILAKTMGIVLVAEADIDVHRWQAQVLSLDGSTGEVWAEARTVAVTDWDISPYPIWLNAVQATDIARARGFKGVGLFRTEFLYLQHGKVPPLSLEEQCYIDAVKAAKGKTIIFRLLDLGADKPVAGVTLDQEANPMLGERGVRVLIPRPELLERHLRALLRASSFGPIRLMIPMVSDRGEVVVVREVLNRLGGEHIPLGIMLETPAALLMVPELCQVAEFFSLGTNDLTAYVYATDRENRTQNLPSSGEALFRLMALAVQAAKQQAREVGVCGELAAHPQHGPRFLELGCSYLSMAASAFPGIAEELAKRGK